MCTHEYQQQLHVFPSQKQKKEKKNKYIKSSYRSLSFILLPFESIIIQYVFSNTIKKEVNYRFNDVHPRYRET